LRILQRVLQIAIIAQNRINLRELVKMDINMFQILDHLVNLGSFKKAAAQNFVSTSTLTRQMSAMEEELGFMLFERTPSGICLTPQGELFYQETKSILPIFESAVTHARMTTFGHQPVRVGIYGYNRDQITNACEAIKNQFPQVDFSFVSCRLRDTRALLMNHGIDLALLVNIEGSEDRLLAIPFFDTYNAVIMSEKHPLAAAASLRFQDINGETILLSLKRPIDRNHVVMRHLFEEKCPRSLLLDFQNPEQADALCMMNHYLISTIGHLEPGKGLKKVRIEDAPKVKIGAMCRLEDEKSLRPMMEYYRDRHCQGWIRQS